jgi:hypothetical protein
MVWRVPPENIARVGFFASDGHARVLDDREAWSPYRV